MNNTTRSQGTGRLKQFLSLALVAILAAALALPLNMQSAYADPTSAEVQAQADEVSAQLAASEEQMVQIWEDYQAAVNAHEDAVASMNEAQARIDAAEEIINDTQSRLGDRATSMYREGPLNFLNVLFGASSFEEFTTSWDLINVINQENADLIQTNKDAQAEAEAAHKEFSAKEAEAADRLAETEAIKTNAEAMIAEQQALLESLSAEVAELVEQEQAAAAAAAAAAAEAQIADSPSYDSSTPPAEIPPGGYSSVVAAAASRVGLPYVYGATGPNAFDCSGLTSWSYSQAGLGYIGRTDSAQYANAAARWPYSSGGAEPGDVLWWPGHVGIYAGGGSYIHAANPSDGILYSSWNLSSATVLRF